MTKATAGTVAKLSNSNPSTYDQSGYEALGDFSQLGKVQRINGFGPKWNTEASNDIDKTGTRYTKTNRDGGSVTIELDLDTDDAGQIKAKASRDSASIVSSLQLTTPNGDDYYCQLAVTEFTVNLDAQGSKQRATLVGMVTVSDDDVDWVEVLA